MSAIAMVSASHSPLLHCHDKEPQDWDALQAAMKKTALWVKAFDPELVIAFGSDHFNGFFLKMMPSFCVGLTAEATSDIGGYPGMLAVPTDTAIAMVEYLRANDIDPAVSYRMTVDHGFSQTIYEILGGLDNIPVIPIFINRITTPFVPFRRSRMLGEALGEFTRTLNKRVLFLGSGGMSHHPTRYYPALHEASDEVKAWQISGGDDPGSFTPEQWLERLQVMHEEGAKMVANGERTAKDMRLNAESDQRFLAIMTSGNFEQYDHWDQYKLVEEAGIGSMELHAWIAAAAAHKSAGGGLPKVDFYSVAPEIGIAAGIIHAEDAS